MELATERPITVSASAFQTAFESARSVLSIKHKGITMIRTADGSVFLKIMNVCFRIEKGEQKE